MNIFGIGTTELIIIFVLMMVVAGPKRMIAWAYVAGQYMAKLRDLWQEASGVLKKELEQAGLEPLAAAGAVHSLFLAVQPADSEAALKALAKNFSDKEPQGG